jgi:hypothetical protein
MCEFLNSLLPALTGLGGVWLGGWLTGRLEREKQTRHFLAQQLSEFYGPLVSLRAEIKARAELRLKIETALDGDYTRKMTEAAYGQVPVSPNEIKEQTQARRSAADEEFEAFKTISMPLYRKMLEIFREELWLAEPGTRDRLPLLIEFVEIWERYLAGTMPADVVGQIKHTERNVHPLYDDLTQVHDRLRAKLS